MKPWTLALGIGVIVLVLGTLRSAEKSKEDAVKQERKKYAGTWQVVALEVDGNKAAEADARKITVINELNGKWTIEADGKVIARGTSVIDPTKEPRTVDLTITVGEGKGDTVLGIYVFNEETRKVCLAPKGKERPTEFTAPSGSGRILAVLKRIKK